MNYSNPIYQKTVGVIRYSCGFLFGIFCFCYFFFLRGEVLAKVQYVLSGGLTHYSLLVGAVIITSLLLIMQWLVSKVFRLPDHYYALTFLPSFVALAMLTDMDQNLDGKFIWGKWVWLVPLIFVLWLLSIFVLKEKHRTTDSVQAMIQSQLWPNFLIMFVMIVCCGFVSSTKDLDHYVMKTERLLEEKDYEAAAGVGMKSLEANERLTQLRMYALSKQNLLADSMFSYPQYFGTNGLLDIHDTVTANRFPMQNIECYLGGFAGRTIKSSLRYLEIIAQEDTMPTPQSLQYLLCYHLLDKNLDAFNNVLRQVYGDTITAELPRAYQEAIIMQNEYTPDSLPIYINKVYVERYENYRSLRVTLIDDKERRNMTRREYGNTYWWYFEN